MSHVDQVHLEKNLQFDIRPFSAFKFGSRNRRPKAENLHFWQKISASGIPLIQGNVLGAKVQRKSLVSGWQGDGKVRVKYSFINSYYSNDLMLQRRPDKTRSVFHLLTQNFHGKPKVQVVFEVQDFQRDECIVHYIYNGLKLFLKSHLNYYQN